jgi:8-amino-7-oxononanoate synthase
LTAAAVETPDFTSARYLGFTHPSAALPRWQALSTGRPAALRPHPAVPSLERRIAELVGMPAACVGTSTLHLFNDLVAGLDPQRDRLLLDAGCYPIACWAAERARGRGVEVGRFRHFDSTDLRRRFAQEAGDGLRPVIVTDGVCTGCGRIAPLPAYLAAARRYGGTVVVDDTQALGILGRREPGSDAFGSGGGGSLRWHALEGAPDCLLIASLAKGLGAPLAALCAGTRRVARFRRAGAALVHCSPPSVPDLLAAHRALSMNEAVGDARRARLLTLIRLLRNELADLDVRMRGGLLPMQCLVGLEPARALRIHRTLSRAGIATLLRRGSVGGAELCIVLTATHRPGDVNALVRALRRHLRHRVPSTHRRRTTLPAPREPQHITAPLARRGQEAARAPITRVL